MNRFPTLTDIKNSKCAHLNKELCEEKPVKKNKYRNQKVEIDGQKFQSLKESRRYIQLRQLQTMGEISDLKLQVPFELNEGGTHSLKYICDFQYLQDGEMIVEDTKGFFTKEFKKKARLMKEIYSIVIKIT